MGRFSQQLSLLLLDFITDEPDEQMQMVILAFHFLSPLSLKQVNFGETRPPNVLAHLISPATPRPRYQMIPAVHQFELAWFFHTCILRYGV